MKKYWPTPPATPSPASKCGSWTAKGATWPMAAKARCLRGRIGNMLGYWQNPQATAAAFTPDGFFRTGDIAVRRPDGRYRLVGRLKEMFKSGGYNVYPREIETVLESHPAVALAAVVAVADPALAGSRRCFRCAKKSGDGCRAARLVSRAARELQDSQALRAARSTAAVADRQGGQGGARNCARPGFDLDSAHERAARSES